MRFNFNPEPDWKKQDLLWEQLYMQWRINFIYEKCLKIGSFLAINRAKYASNSFLTHNLLRKAAKKVLVWVVGPLRGRGRKGLTTKKLKINKKKNVTTKLEGGEG